MASHWVPPSNYRNRPVTILGAGVLGRRIGLYPIPRVIQWIEVLTNFGY